MMHTDFRTVINDFWYTSKQITEVGEHWAKAEPGRIFAYPFIHGEELIYRTGLELDHISQIDKYPQKILLPLNKGRNHWTAVAIDINKNDDQTVTVNIVFTDSLSRTMNKDELESPIQSELARIRALFKTALGDTAQINTQVYKHTWMQPDGSSCGAYALANAMRCLEGKGAEANPGRTVIREQQLNVMTSFSATRGCSTNNQVDEILTDWVFAQISNGQSINISTGEDVAAICSSYAVRHQMTPHDIEQIFHNEYCPDLAHRYRPILVNTRVRELIRELGINVTALNQMPKPVIKPTVGTTTIPDKLVVEKTDVNTSVIDKPEVVPPKGSPKPSEIVLPVVSRTPEMMNLLKKPMENIAKDNISLQIDEIRKILLRAKITESHAYFLMASLVPFMQQRALEDVEKFINTHIESSDDRKNALSLASKIVGARAYSDENNLKLTMLTSCYQGIYGESTRLKSINLETPKHVLQAHIVLLNGAIARNDASAFGQIAFIIKDAIESLVQFVTRGYYEPEHVRITKLAVKFDKTGGKVSSEQYQSERNSIQVLLTSKDSLDKELAVDDVESNRNTFASSF